MMIEIRVGKSGLAIGDWDLSIGDCDLGLGLGLDVGDWVWRLR